MPRPRFEVGQIIRDWRSEFYAKYPVVPQVRKSFGAMAVCRTRALGGHVEVCPECGEIHVSYNSCRDRHCPKCQNKEREVWIEMRKEEILPGENASMSYLPLFIIEAVSLPSLLRLLFPLMTAWTSSPKQG